MAAGQDRALSGLGGQAADQLLDDPYLDRSGALGSQFLNRAAFALPALGTYGNAGFFSVNGFANWSLDAALSRSFAIGTHRLQARVEAFNLLNAVRPADPNFSLSNVNFGRVTAVQDPRIMQFALKYDF